MMVYKTPTIAVDALFYFCLLYSTPIPWVVGIPLGIPRAAMATVLNLPQGGPEVEKPRGSAVEGFPVALDLQGTIHQEVKSPAISVNLSGALPTITGGATSIPTSVAERVRPTVTVEEHVPERVHLQLPAPVQHHWQQRVSAAHRADRRRRATARSIPPLRWYSQELLELCGTTALHLVPKLHQLEEHRQSRPWIWKDGGRLPLMLEQCSILLSEASQVAEAATMHLCTLEQIGPTLRAVREKCFPPPHVEPTLHACLECSTAEEAMALATVELSRLQGSGSAIGCALRSGSSMSMLDLKATFEDASLWEDLGPWDRRQQMGIFGVPNPRDQTFGKKRQDFVNLVPFLEMTLSKLGILVDLVFQQLEEDFLIVPPDVDSDSPDHGDTFASGNLETSPSIAALWAAQEAELAKEASDQEDSPMFGRQLSDAASEGGGDAAPKTNRKKGKKKTLTGSPKSARSKK
eukprot:symbB.v1.2.003281.t1/scaffold184.1/size280901/9